MNHFFFSLRHTTWMAITNHRFYKSSKIGSSDNSQTTLDIIQLSIKYSKLLRYKIIKRDQPLVDPVLTHSKNSSKHWWEHKTAMILQCKAYLCS
jgi:hypothetical protein